MKWAGGWLGGGIRCRNGQCGLSWDLPLRETGCPLNIIVFSQLALPLRKPESMLKSRGATCRLAVTDQPSGNEGGDCVGPSWFPGVGGPLMTERLMIRSD